MCARYSRRQVQKPVTSSSILPHIIFETGFLDELGTHRFGHIGLPVGTQNPPISISPPELALQACTIMPVFHMGARSPNPGPHAYAASSYPLS